MANSLFLKGSGLSGSQVVAAGPVATRLIPTNQEGGVFWSRAVLVAKAGNSAAIQFGGSDVDGSTNGGLGATAGTNDSQELVAVNRLPFDASDIFIFGSTGEGVDFWLYK